MIKNDFVFNSIAAIVLFFHCCLLIVLAFEEKKEIPLQPKSQRLIVQTIQIKAKAPALPSKEIKSPVSNAIAKSTPKPIIKPKMVSKEKPEIQKKEIVKKSPPTKNNDIQKKLLKMAQESLAKIEKSSDNLELNSVKVDHKIGKLEKIGNLKSISEMTSEEGSKNKLCSQLRSFLKLPEHGDVEIKLSLDKNGKVIALKILDAKSERNKKYIEELLPKLTFSLKGTDFGKESIKSFNITLTNE